MTISADSLAPVADRVGTGTHGGPPIRALSVQNPWAWAIFHGKNIENRTQQWSYRGLLAIHSGMRESERGLADPRIRAQLEQAVDDELVGRPGPHGYAPGFGVILGIVDLVDVHPDAGCCKPWGESAYVEHGGRQRRRVVHLVLEEPRLLPEPIPCRGALGLWTPPAHVIDRCEALR